MAHNKIEVIPEEIIKLINLEVFDLSHNNISLYDTISFYIFFLYFYITIFILQLFYLSINYKALCNELSLQNTFLHWDITQFKTV